MEKNNFTIHTVILYFTASTDKSTLDQIYIAGGHIGGGGGAGNDGSDEGRWRRAGAAGRRVAASAGTAAAGMALEKRRWSAGGLALAARYYVEYDTIYCVKNSALQKCSVYLSTIDRGLRAPGFKRQTLNLTYLAGPCEQGIATSNLNSSLSCCSYRFALIKCNTLVCLIESFPASPICRGLPMFWCTCAC